MSADWATGITGRIHCPACNAKRGEPCVMRFAGEEVLGAHDARVYADLWMGAHPLFKMSP